MHIHVISPEGEAKFWIVPAVELAKNHGLSSANLKRVEGLVRDRQEDIRDAWNRHFGD